MKTINAEKIHLIILEAKKEPNKYHSIYFSEYDSPNDVQRYFEGQGYERGEHDTNGWDHDFWIPYSKEGEPTIWHKGSWWYGTNNFSYDPDKKNIYS